MNAQAHDLDRIAITVKSHMLLKQLLKENPVLEEIMRNARNETEALVGMRNWVLEILKSHPDAYRFYKRETKGREAFEKLTWEDFTAIRLLDYVDNAGREFEDQNLRGEKAVSNPIQLIWLATTKGTGGAKPAFFEDMLQLFRQFSGKAPRSVPKKREVEAWMERWCSGLDPRIIKLREENRERILKILIRKMDEGEIRDAHYAFTKGMSQEQKYLQMLDWWNESLFHLRFAVRTPDLLNELLGFSLDPDTMKVLYEAQEKGIPFFVNPYYLSLLHVRVPYFAIGADLAIRYYVIYSQQLIDEYGHIVAWEKEDKVEPGKPNAAGWLLPSEHNLHRRYPEVAILITGGDALMSSNHSLEKILDKIYIMAERKKEANLSRPEGEKFAELVRVRLGTRLPVYLPQRITPELTAILKSFRERAMQAGIRQFVIQTHFESPMEVTPEAREAVGMLIAAGWTVVNQHVFSTAASRRGHAAKLRRVLNEIGILNYYTFSVKGYMENNFNFATNERAVQEQMEEKVYGRIPEKYFDRIRHFSDEPELMEDHITELMKKSNLPFLGTDRNVLNLPGVEKSLTFRTIGITRYGRRILEFEHDATRTHSPIIEEMGRIIIIESKSIGEYLDQLEAIGENVSDYESIWGYSIGETEPRIPIYEYPDYDFTVTDRVTNLELAQAFQ